MSYSTDRARLIADQVARLATQNLHQLAGQAANLDFWLAEAGAALAVIDDYPARFARQRDAQIGWVKAHGTRVSEYCPYCRGACEFGPSPPSPPSRVPQDEFAEARRSVRTAMFRFLLRLYRAHFLDEAAVREHCDRLGIDVEPEDLRRS